MHVPERIEPRGLADYLETMSKSVFQTGISWRVVDSKWPDIREAMREFDPYTIAKFGEMELEELANDKRVIRNRRKLHAIVDNARQMIDLEAKHGSFRDYLRSHDDFDATVAAVVGRLHVRRCQSGSSRASYTTPPSTSRGMGTPRR